MNGKKAKALRRLARKATKGEPELAYQKRKDTVKKKDGTTAEAELGGWELSNISGRGAGKQLKKAYLDHIRGGNVEA